MRVAFIFFLVYFSLLLQGSAQINQSLTQYYNSLHTINPAFIGLNNYSEFRVGFRQPWSEISEINNTNFANLSTTIRKKSPFDYRSQPLRISNPSALGRVGTKVFSRKHGIGLHFLQNENGAFKENSVRGVYAYHLPLTKKSYLSFGTSLIWLQQEIDFSQLTVRDNDLFFNELVASGDRINYFKLDAGILFYHERFYLGFTLNSAVDEVISGTDLLSTSSVGDAFTAIIGNKIPLSVNFWLHPTFQFARTSPGNEKWSLDSKLTYKDKFMVGVMYQNTGLYSGLLELRVSDSFSVGYSYDYSSDELADLSNGFHEISLGVLLSKLHNRSSLIWQY